MNAFYIGLAGLGFGLGSLFGVFASRAFGPAPKGCYLGVGLTITASLFLIVMHAPY